jgi:undecaprenyl-diphosphatase
MPEWVSVIILSIVEGLTEFIPVSSTGHMLIVSPLLHRQTDLFYIVIQSGAVIAVIPLVWGRIKKMLFDWREPETRDFMFKLAAAFGITGVGGLMLEKMGYTLPEEVGPVAWALLLGGAVFIAVETWLKGKPLSNEITWTIAIAVGIGQLIAAIFPGASRSGTTIMLALVLGLNRPLATEFSFLVGIPTMLAAGGFKIFQSLRQVEGAPAEDWGLVALGTIVSAIVSFIAVKWLLRFIQTHTFIGFGYYRIVVGLLLLSLAWFHTPEE